MRRRQFITLLGGAAATWPIVARAQQPERMRRIGVLMNAAATETRPQSYVATFMEALRQLGWTEDQNLRVDIRWNAGDAALARTYAAQLIGLMPDVILASSTTNLTVIQQATSTVPVVFMQVSDPVAQGFVGSLTKPGGNLGLQHARVLDWRNGLTCSRKLCLASRGSRSCSTPTHRRSRSSSCVRSRPLRRPSACRRLLSPFASPPTSNPPWSASGVSRTAADPADRQLLAVAPKADRRPGRPQSPAVGRRAI